MSGVCGICGCTEDKPCACGCAWMDARRDLCTNCAEMMALIAQWACDCHQPMFAVLARAAKLLYEQLQAEANAGVIVPPTPDQVRVLGAGTGGRS